LSVPMESEGVGFRKRVTGAAESGKRGEGRMARGCEERMSGAAAGSAPMKRWAQSLRRRLAWVAAMAKRSGGRRVGGGGGAERGWARSAA